MSPEHRYVGVARPPEGAAADRPRLVVDLSGARTARSRPRQPVEVEPVSHAATIPSASALGTTPTPQVVAWPPRPEAERLVRLRRWSKVAEHRRQWPHGVWRRFEVAAWITCVGVVVGVGAAIATANPVPGLTVGQVGGPTVRTPPNCALEPCDRAPLAGTPTRVRIPAIKVDQPLEVLARSATGELQPPKTYERPGWFGNGIVPGNTGPAVIAGHVDSKAGPAVFSDLHRLRPGDLVEVLRGDRWIPFLVNGTEQYPKAEFPTKRVYMATPDAELRLITCGGTFDETRGSYRDNIVVYATIDWSMLPMSVNDPDMTADPRSP